MTKSAGDTPYVERQGGSYIRDPETGELRNELDVPPKPQGEAEPIAAQKPKKGE